MPFYYCYSFCNEQYGYGFLDLLKVLAYIIFSPFVILFYIGKYTCFPLVKWCISEDGWLSKYTMKDVAYFLMHCSSVVFFGMDTLDMVLDFIEVHNLSVLCETGFAAWLGLMTVLSSMVEYVLKPWLVWKKKKDKTETEIEKKPKDEDIYSAGDEATFDIGSTMGLLHYIEVTATMELIIFYLEDCTTLFIWYITGSYKKRDANGDDVPSKASRMNLITTMVSASIAALAMFGSSIAMANSPAFDKATGKIGKKGCFKSGSTKSQKCFQISKMATVLVLGQFFVLCAFEDGSGSQFSDLAAAVQSRCMRYPIACISACRILTYVTCYYIRRLATLKMFNYMCIGFWLFVAVQINNDQKALATNRIGCHEARLAELGEASCIGQTITQAACADAAIELLPDVKWCALCDDVLEDGEEVDLENAYHGCSVHERSDDSGVTVFEAIYNTNEDGADENSEYRMICDTGADGVASRHRRDVDFWYEPIGTAAERSELKTILAWNDPAHLRNGNFRQTKTCNGKLDPAECTDASACETVSKTEWHNCPAMCGSCVEEESKRRRDETDLLESGNGSEIDSGSGSGSSNSNDATTTTSTTTPTTTNWFSAFDGNDKNQKSRGRATIFSEDFDDNDAITRWGGIGSPDDLSAEFSTIVTGASLVTNRKGNKMCKSGSCLQFTQCGPEPIHGSVFSTAEFACSYSARFVLKVCQKC
jgi:hypothetical protein